MCTIISLIVIQILGVASVIGRVLISSEMHWSYITSLIAGILNAEHLVCAELTCTNTTYLSLNTSYLL